jgi:hypothetical protein
MRYAYHDLGEQDAGATVTVRWGGGGAKALLMDPVSFSKYCRNRNLVFRASGGHYGRSPARFTIPETGRWYVVLDLGSYSGHAEATVEIVDPHAEGASQHEETLVGSARDR